MILHQHKSLFDNVESWNGTAWTEVNELNTKEVGISFGTSTATLVVGGWFSKCFSESSVESWNGSAWTEVNDLNTARFWNGGAGTTLQH